MISHTTSTFRQLLNKLPADVRKQARDAYRQFKHNPFYPSLHFKKVHTKRPIYSARINIDYRAVGIIDGEEIIWFWIGPHKDYEKLLARL
ncbi:MAG: hypothetical protein WCI11_10720 [Candidatus Methylumidiphilus sp.]